MARGCFAVSRNTHWLTPGPSFTSFLSTPGQGWPSYLYLFPRTRTRAPECSLARDDRPSPQALISLRLAVPLDLRPRPAEPGRCAGGLAAVAALRQLRRLDLLPINGLTSRDIEPLGALGGTLEHLELYLVG